MERVYVLHISLGLFRLTLLSAETLLPICSAAVRAGRTTLTKKDMYAGVDRFTQGETRPALPTNHRLPLLAFSAKEVSGWILLCCVLELVDIIALVGQLDQQISSWPCWHSQVWRYANKWQSCLCFCVGAWLCTAHRTLVRHVVPTLIAYFQALIISTQTLAVCM